MSVNIRESQNTAIVEIKGRLIDDSLAHEVSRRLHSLIDSGKKNLVIDLAGVDYISSFGFALLISGLKSTREKGGNMKLANISRKAGSLLSTTKLDQIFEEYDSVELAVNSYVN